MYRYKILIEYDGTGFVGWQRQDNGLSVQQAIEEAVANFSVQSVKVFGAGRTDSGVHALGQVAHFNLEKEQTPDTVRKALNFHLKPAAIAVLKAASVDADFDARLSATGRSPRDAPEGLARGKPPLPGPIGLPPASAAGPRRRS